MNYSDFWPDPWQQQSGMPPGWDDIGFGGLVSPAQSGMFQDPLAPARAFYGEAVLQSIMEGQQRQLEQQRIRAERLPEMVDDVAAQWAHDL